MVEVLIQHAMDAGNAGWHIDARFPTASMLKESGGDVALS